jgi:bacteriocin biosynthesis cyclodehydratase domain-containing protein
MSLSAPSPAVASPEGDELERCYTLSPGIEFAVVAGMRLVFKSSSVKVEMEGESAVAFAQKIVPMLSPHRSVEELSALTGFDRSDLASHLAGLHDSGVLSHSRRDTPDERTAASALYDLLEPLGYNADYVSKRLLAQKIAVLGLEASGVECALQLGLAGVGEVHLYDPGFAKPDDPAAIAGDTVKARHALAADYLRGRGIKSQVYSSLAAAWTKEEVARLAGEMEIIICSVDTDNAHVAHWVNKAVHETGKIAAFVTIQGGKAVVGPIVFPHETACFMCYRMRYLATRDDFAVDMEFEEQRDKRRGSSAVREPCLPSLQPVAAGILSAEIIKTVLSAGRHGLAGRIIEYDGFEGRFTEHEVLAQPNCPVCSKKNC